MLRVKENNNVTLPCVVRRQDGSPLDITGWTFRFQVRNKSGQIIIDKQSSNPLQIAVISAVAGSLETYILPADTLDKVGMHVFELKGFDPTGRAYTLDGPEDFQVTDTVIV
jgi:hypothetical protein